MTDAKKLEQENAQLLKLVADCHDALDPAVGGEPEPQTDPDTLLERVKECVTLLRLARGEVQRLARDVSKAEMRGACFKLLRATAEQAVKRGDLSALENVLRKPEIANDGGKV